MIETSFHHEKFYLQILDCLFESLSVPHSFTVGGGNAPKCTLPTAIRQEKKNKGVSGSQVSTGDPNLAKGSDAGIRPSNGFLMTGLMFTRFVKKNLIKRLDKL